jgi:hypothetical protein
MSNVYTFSLQAVYVAANNGDGTYGTVYEMESSKTLRVAQKIVSDKAQGNSRITALAAQSLGDYDLSLGTAGIDQEALEIFQDTTETASNDGSYTDFSNQLMPYFGMIAQTYPDDGDVLLWFPNCKVMSDFTFSLEFVKIVIPEFKCEAIQIGSYYNYAMRLLERPDGGAITFPPTIPA